MKLLLDTHVWLWMAFQPERLQASVRETMLDPHNELFVSAATIWEIAIKTGPGKLELPTSLADFVAAQTGPGVAETISIAPEHAVALTSLPAHHRDPFDRMLVAQAKCEGMTLVTADESLRAYGVAILWAG